MKQKILLRIAMTDDKTRAKAMKTAVKFKGVSAAEIKGDHRNQIEVTGDEVAMIALINKLRKDVAFAELVSVSKVEPPKDGDKKDEKKPEGDNKDEKKPEGDNKDEKKLEPCCQPWPYGYGVPASYSYPCDPYPCDPYPCDPYPCDPYHHMGKPVYNSDPGCTIM